MTSDNIKRILKLRKISQQTFANRCNISIRGFQKMLHNNYFRYSTLQKMAIELKVPMEDLKNENVISDNIIQLANNNDGLIDFLIKFIIDLENKELIGTAQRKRIVKYVLKNY